MAVGRNPRRKFPWLEIVLLLGLAMIFAVTYWQYKDAQRDFQKHQEEVAPPLPKKEITPSRPKK